MAVIAGPPGGASALSSVFTLLNSAIGAGVLSFPFAFRAAGWAGGLLLTFVVAAVEGCTMFWMAKYAEFTQSRTYSELVRRLLGKRAAAAMSVVLILYSYGSGTAYLIILGDCFQPLAAAAGGAAWWAARPVVIAALGTACMLPLCFPRTLDAISGVSSVTFFALIAVVSAIVQRSAAAVGAPGYDWSRVHAFRPLLSCLDALPILAFGFQCHTNVAAVFHELEDEPELILGSAGNLAALVTGGGGNSAAAAEQEQEAASQAPGPQPPPRVVVLHRPARRFVRPAGRAWSQKLEGMVHVLCASLGLTAVFYCLVGLAGYLQFPATALSNILRNYADSDRLMLGARALVGIIQIIHYPVNHFPCRSATRELLAQLTGRPLAGATFAAAEPLAFFGITLSLALSVTDLGSVFKLVGGVCCSFFIFFVPGAFVLQYSISKHLTVLQRGAAGGGGGLGAPLLDGGGAAAEAAEAAEAPADHGPPAGYHYLGSKLFWSGVVLELLGLGLLGLTIWTLVVPAHPSP